LTVENTNIGTSYGGSFSKSRLEETGFSYTGNASRSALGAQNYNARADYQGTHALYGVQMDRMGNQQSTVGNVSGSVVMGGGGFFLAPPLGSAFAIIHAPKAPNAPVLRESTPVGQTNKRGFALIRNLTPFYPSQIGFDPASLDINVDTGNIISKTILPTAYTATLVEFDAAPAQAIQAQLAWPDGTFLKYGSIRFGEPLNQEISLGGTGLLWLEKIPAGSYEGLATTEQGCKQAKWYMPMVFVKRAKTPQWAATYLRRSNGVCCLERANAQINPLKIKASLYYSLFPLAPAAMLL